MKELLLSFGTIKTKSENALGLFQNIIYKSLFETINSTWKQQFVPAYLPPVLQSLLLWLLKKKSGILTVSFSSFVMCREANSAANSAFSLFPSLTCLIIKTETTAAVQSRPVREWKQTQLQLEWLVLLLLPPEDVCFAYFVDMQVPPGVSWFLWAFHVVFQTFGPAST